MQNQNMGASLGKFGLSALEKGLEGNVNRQRARNQAYGNAVGISQQQNAFNSAIENQNTNSVLGAAQSAAAASGNLLAQSSSSNNASSENPADPKKQGK